MLDFEALLRPVDAADPAGPDLAYSGVAQLQRLAAGRPGPPDPATHEPAAAPEPDWREVLASASELLGRSKDLRVAAWLVRAELANRGLAGLADGLRLVARLLGDFWDTLHPRLAPGEGGPAIERLNALADLASDPGWSHGSTASAGLVRALRAVVVVDSREFGRHTLRDLDCALGRLPAPPEVPAPTLDLLAAAWRTSDADQRRRWRADVLAAQAALGSIERSVVERCGERPALDLLSQTLSRVADFQARAGQACGEPPADPLPERPEIAASVSLSARSAAVKQLLQVAQFLRDTEPSSPAPLFIDRAVRLLQMDFPAIVRELMPDARERIETLAGISLRGPADD